MASPAAAAVAVAGRAHPPGGGHEAATPSVGGDRRGELRRNIDNRIHVGSTLDGLYTDLAGYDSF